MFAQEQFLCLQEQETSAAVLFSIQSADAVLHPRLHVRPVFLRVMCTDAEC